MLRLTTERQTRQSSRVKRLQTWLWRYVFFRLCFSCGITTTEVWNTFRVDEGVVRLNTDAIEGLRQHIEELLVCQLDTLQFAFLAITRGAEIYGLSDAGTGVGKSSGQRTFNEEVL